MGWFLKAYQVPLRENGWFVLNTASPASRSQFMQVLKNLRRVLVRATLVKNILSTTIADVSMDTATENFNGAPPAKGVEVCYYCGMNDWRNFNIHQ